MKRKEAFPSRFLAKEDLQDQDGHYTEMTGTIEDVRMSEIPGGEEEKPVM